MIQLVSISKSYKTGKEGSCEAIRDLSISFPSKGMVFIVGKSGSGKSTLLNIIGGIEKPTSGKVLFSGNDIAEFDSKHLNAYRQNEVGFCFQKLNLISALSVRDNIRLSGEAKGFDEKRFGEVVSSCKLSGLENRLCSELSGGQQQRVAIARALYKNPAIVLADEPTGSLDSVTAASIFSTLKSISKDRLVVVVSHDLESAEKYADRLVRLQDGAVVSGDEPPKTIENDSSIAKENLHAPFGVRLKLEWAALRKMPVRLISSCLIIGVAFGIIGPFLSQTLRDEASFLADSIVSSGSRTLSFGECSKKSGFGNGVRKSTKEDLEALSDIYGDDFLTVYNDSSDYLGTINICSYSNSAFTKPTEYSLDSYTLGMAAGLASVNDIGKIGLDVDYGVKPSSNMECALPLLAYEGWAKYGFANGKGQTILSKEITSPDAFLSLEPEIPVYVLGSRKYLKIVGIVDTRFNGEKYEETIDPRTQIGMGQMAQLGEELRYGPHTLVFVDGSNLPNLDEKEETIDFLISNEQMEYKNGSFAQTFTKVSRCKDVLSSFIGSDKRSEEGVFLPTGAFGDIIDDDYLVTLEDSAKYNYRECLEFFKPFSEVDKEDNLTDPDLLFAPLTEIEGVSPLALTAAGAYVRDNGLPAGENLAAFAEYASEVYSAESLAEHGLDFSSLGEKELAVLKSLYVWYLSTDVLKRTIDNHMNYVGSGVGGFTSNSFDSISGREIAKKFADKIVNAIPSSKIKKASISVSSISLGEVSYEPNVLGLSLLDDAPEATDALFSKVVDNFGDSGKVRFVVYGVFPSKDTIKKAVKGTHSDRGTYLAHNEILGGYSSLGNSFGKSLSIFFLVAICVFLPFSAVLLVTMLSSSSRFRRREMTIRRSLGMSKSGEFLDLSVECLIVGLVGFCVSLIFGAILVPVFNANVASLFGVSLAYLSLSPLALFVCFAIIVALCFLSAAPASFSEAKKSSASRLLEE